LLIRKVFGASSEKLDPSQLDLFLLQGENAPGKAQASSALEEADPQRSRHRPAPKEKHLPDNLPVIEEVIDPEEVKEAPDQWRCIGSEVSEQLDCEPARFLKRRLVRRKYVSRQNPEDAPVIAALPPRLQERSIPAAGLLAQITVSKMWTIFRFTGRSRFIGRGTGSGCRDKATPGGWGWWPIGSSRSTTLSDPA
jgi:transposase